MPALTILAKYDPFMKLKRKKLGPIIDLKEDRREQAITHAMVAEEDTSVSSRRRGKTCLLLEEEAGCANLLVYPKEGKGTLRKIPLTISFLFFLVSLNRRAKACLLLILKVGEGSTTLET